MSSLKEVNKKFPLKTTLNVTINVTIGQLLQKLSNPPMNMSLRTAAKQM